MPKLIDMVRDVAPALSAGLTLTGPAGVIAAAALNSALGLSKDAGEAAQTKALAAATPEQLLAIKQADNDFALKMREADSADLASDVADRTSARLRDTAAGSDVFNHVIMAGLSGFALVLLIFIIYIVATQPLQAAAHDIFLILIGTITGIVTQVYNYYFGSSSGSTKKSEGITAALMSKK